MKKSITLWKAILCCLICVMAAAGVGGFIAYQIFMLQFPDYKANNDIYSKLAQIRATVDAYYVGEYELQDAVDMAATGYMVGIGDVWSSYMSKEEYEEYKLSFSGKSFGVGMYVSYDAEKNEAKIVEIYDDSDAAKYGIKKGDILIGAEDKTIQNDGYEEVVNAIKGDEGTMASVTFYHSDTGETETVNLERKTIEKTMASGWILEDGITGMVRIYDFDNGSETQIIDEVEKLIDEGIERVVFDVRNNPGGAVKSVCDALDYLLPEGTIMTLSTKQGEETVYESDENELDIPIAVLVNESSISAAEFFAAALQEYDKAIIVGTKTIGKGYSQHLYELNDGSAINLSSQEYFTPNGNSLIGVGITPDIVIEPEEDFNLHFTPENEDVQLTSAVNALNNLSAK